MKTTVDIPSDLYRQAKVRAAMEGRRIKDLVAEGLVLILGRGKGGDAVQTTALEAMHDACGCVDSGIPDLATNPDHLQGFGRG